MKKTTAPIKFDSDDTEGSDLSYESSFDEKEDNQGASSSLFKIIMKTNLAKCNCYFVFIDDAHQRSKRTSTCSRSRWYVTC